MRCQDTEQPLASARNLLKIGISSHGQTRGCACAPRSVQLEFEQEIAMKKEMNYGRQGQIPLPETDVAGATDAMPRRMSFAENLIVTVKVLAGFGFLGAALWGLELWKSLR
jgi:hypothetical protein